MGCVRFIDAAAGDLVSSIWYDSLRRSVAHHGGLLNAHLHLDRAGTFDDRYLSGTGHRMAKDFHVSLRHKHALIADLIAVRPLIALNFMHLIIAGLSRTALASVSSRPLVTRITL